MEADESTVSLKNGVGSFKQQDLKGWQPVLTPVAVISMLLCITIVFLPIGIVLRDSSDNVIEQVTRYDNIDECKVTANDNYTILPKICHVTITIKQDMNAPIYFYYQLDKFYQNHRRYLKSKSNSQLRGQNVATKDFEKSCDPLKYNINDNKRLVACGLIAGSFFEDRFSMKVVSTNNVTTMLCNETTNCINYGQNNSQGWQNGWSNWHDNPNWMMEGIAWQSDLEEKFKKIDRPNNTYSFQGPRQMQTGLRLPDIDNEDFVVWMRVAALPNFRKLHRKISQKNLKQGDKVTVTIANWFPVSEFGGSKSFVLAKTVWCGGKNVALAWTYIVVAIVSIILAVLLTIALVFGKRKMADVDMFEWHNKPSKDEIYIDTQ